MHLEGCLWLCTVCFFPVLTGLRKHEDGWVFEEPVTEDIAPGYSEIIDKPMDYLTIEKKIEKCEYTTKEQVCLMGKRKAGEGKRLERGHGEGGREKKRKKREEGGWRKGGEKERGKENTPWMSVLNSLFCYCSLRRMFNLCLRTVRSTMAKTANTTTLPMTCSNSLTSS